MNEKITVVQNKLICLFDDMLKKLPDFKKANFEDQFQSAYSKHKDVCDEISGCMNSHPESLDEIADILPAYVQGLMSEYSRKKRQDMSMQYNMNMAVYVIPVLTYSKNDNCMKAAEKMVEMWNEKKVTDLTLGLSSYEMISSGFRKKLCYITTAVCESLHKDDHCEELTCLRKYRDEYLADSQGGAALIKEYYGIAPVLVLMINMQPEREIIYRGLYRRYLSPCIDAINDSDMERCKKIYTDMVNHLKKGDFVRPIEKRSILCRN